MKERIEVMMMMIIIIIIIIMRGEKGGVEVEIKKKYRNFLETKIYSWEILFESSDAS